MVTLMKKLAVKYVGGEDYLPEGMPKDKFIPVIGFETRRVEREVKGEKRVFEDILFLVIGDTGKIVKVAEFNCRVSIISAEEVNYEKLNQSLSSVVTSLKIMGGYCAAKLPEKGNQSNSSSNGKSLPDEEQG